LGYLLCTGRRVNLSVSNTNSLRTIQKPCQWLPKDRDNYYRD